MPDDQQYSIILSKNICQSFIYLNLLTNLNLKQVSAIIIEINHHSNKQNYYIDRLKITFRKKKREREKKLLNLIQNFP